MNKPDEGAEDELTRAYRRASDAEAGSPAASTRAAILAEARAASLRRTPAANDSRYIWRAAAGIAVLGVAVILWRQTDHRLAPDLTVAAQDSKAETPLPTTASQPEADVAIADSGGAAAVADKRAAGPPEAAPASKDVREVQSKAAPARREREEAAESAAKSDAPQANLQLARASADAEVPMPVVAPIQAAGSIRKDGPDYQQLLQREFPAVWNGNEPPHTVWLVIDGKGNVLRKGSLLPGATVTADQPFESQRPWEMIDVKTASGRTLQLAVMTTN
jgi:hypothetical protein